MNISMKNYLDRLGFTEEWVSFGVISESILSDLYKEISVSEDENAEHYRHRAFSQYLKSKSSLSDEEVANIFRLEDRGPDKCDLRVNRINELLHSDILTDHQLESLIEFSTVTEPPIQKLYIAKKLIRNIDKNGVGACFEEIKCVNDPDVNDYALRCNDLEFDHVDWFRKYAGNKRVRNIANQLISSKRYKK